MPNKKKYPCPLPLALLGGTYFKDFYRGGKIKSKAVN